MPKGGLKTRNTDQWTEARFRSFITSAIRNASTRWGPKYLCIKRAFVSHGKNPKTGRMCKLHKCAMCDELFPQSDMRADHINPVVDPTIGFVDWDTYIDRMFVEVEGFQALCQTCHHRKSQAERMQRRGVTLAKAKRKRR